MVVIRKIEWKRRNKKLAEEMEEYFKEYRRKVCSKCSKECREARNCIIYPEEKTMCNHMIKARTNIFRDRIYKEIRTLASFNAPLLESA